jgi:PPOX class probable FMN-dependent enzyme
VAHDITSIEALGALYGQASEASIAKEVDFIHPHYQAFIEASPFCILATSGPEGLDCTPRGDAPGFVTVEDPHTLLVPDRRGNNRVDSLRNIVRDPRIALLFLVPGVGETLRVNGRAVITTDPDLLDRFVMEGKPPKSVLRVTAERVYFQCPKALVRSHLWDPARHVVRSSLPSAGTILRDITAGRMGGEAYDQAYPQRLKETMY